MKKPPRVDLIKRTPYTATVKRHDERGGGFDAVVSIRCPTNPMLATALAGSVALALLQVHLQK